MTSTNTDGDASSSKSNDKPENPFIRFRRFADAQVGAVLQGIIGLPSAFSKQSSEANSRWTDFQDELRRREKVHTGVGASEISETNNIRASDDEEFESPVKVVRGGSSPPSSQPKPPNPSANTTGGPHQYEVDLYSPITKALFEHFIRGSSDEVDGNKAPTIDSQIKIRNPWDLFEDQKSKSALSIIQTMVYNDLYLGRTHKTNLCNHMHSSIIPYVLFSPYSPLALSDMPTPLKGRALHGRNRRDIPYMAAFEDLLLASQDRPMGFWTYARGDSSTRLARHFDEMIYAPENGTSFFANPELKDQPRKVSEGLTWVRDLGCYGLLGLEPTDAEREWAEWPAYLQTAEHKLCKDSVSPYSGCEHEYLSEQDAYDRLIELDESTGMDRRTSSALSGEPLIKAVATIDDENLLRRIFRETEKDEYESGQDTPANRSLRNTELSSLGHFIRELFIDGLKSTSTSTKTESSDDSSPKTSKNLVAMTKYDTREQESESRADQPISTTRTTEQTINESGMVETKVTIEKIFANGRRNVTITEHVEVPSERWRGVGERDAENWKEGKEETADGNAEGTKNNEKENIRGWFWN